MIQDDIGVVVIGRNEGMRLIACLQTVKTCCDHVVYVDSASTDGSVPNADRMGVSVLSLDLTCPFTAARARNTGFAAIKAKTPTIKFVQFIDGDCKLVSDWLPNAYLFMNRHDDVAIACGRRREAHPEASIYNRLCDFEWDTVIGETSACGGDSLVRAEAFEMVGGFRDGLIAGEEPELCVRLRERGWKIWRLDLEMTRHDAAMLRFNQWWTRAVRSGYGMTEVSGLHWHSEFAIWKREVARAVFWGGFVPCLIIVGAFLKLSALVAFLVYPLQVCRISVTQRPRSTRWSYAFFLTLAKFAEFEGFLKFQWRRLLGRSGGLIEYK